jgi:hypothetical protein
MIILPCVGLGWVEQAADAETRLTVQALQNAEYRSEQFGESWVRLKNGKYEERSQPGAVPEFVMRLSDKMAFGDLNDDGVQDAAVVLISSGGGSGSFRELIAVLDRNGRPQQAASAFLGDRTDIKSISIRSGIIFVDLVRHGPNDPMCCPTVREVKKYKLNGGRLKAIP